RQGRRPGSDRRGGPGGSGRSGRLTVSESLSQSAMIRGGSGQLPLRETALVVALINHPELIDENFDHVERLSVSHPDLKRLFGAVIDAMAHGVASERSALVAAIVEAG